MRSLPRPVLDVGGTNGFSFSGTNVVVQVNQNGGSFPDTGGKCSAAVTVGSDITATFADPHPDPPRDDGYFHWNNPDVLALET